MKPRHKRLAIIVGGLAALGIAAALVTADRWAARKLDKEAA